MEEKVAPLEAVMEVEEDMIETVMPDGEVTGQEEEEGVCRLVCLKP